MIHKPLFVLSPCGTSLLTNSATPDEKKLVFQYSNAARKEQIPLEHAAVLEALISRVNASLLSSGIEDATRLSAELNGILSIYEKRLTNRISGDCHLLLCTDTWLGEVAGELVKQWLSQNGFTVDIRRQKDLQTEDLEAFQLALSEMVSWMENEISRWKSGYRIIFNLTGGFKSVQGFLQTLAMFYADEAVYIFETGNSLMRIPRLPVEMTVPAVLKAQLDFFGNWTWKSNLIQHHLRICLTVWL